MPITSYRTRNCKQHHLPLYCCSAIPLLLAGMSWFESQISQEHQGWWFHGCVYMSKLIKLYTLNPYIFVYQLYFNKAAFLRKIIFEVKCTDLFHSRCVLCFLLGCFLSFTCLLATLILMTVSLENIVWWLIITPQCILLNRQTWT